MGEEPVDPGDHLWQCSRDHCDWYQPGHRQRRRARIVRPVGQQPQRRHHEDALGGDGQPPPQPLDAPPVDCTGRPVPEVGGGDSGAECCRPQQHDGPHRHRVEIDAQRRPDGEADHVAGGHTPSPSGAGEPPIGQRHQQVQSERGQQPERKSHRNGGCFVRRVGTGHQRLRNTQHSRSDGTGQHDRPEPVLASLDAERHAAAAHSATRIAPTTCVAVGLLVTISPAPASPMATGAARTHHAGLSSCSAPPGDCRTSSGRSPSEGFARALTSVPVGASVPAMTFIGTSRADFDNGGKGVHPRPCRGASITPV